jgi:hypothetical protein
MVLFYIFNHILIFKMADIDTIDTKVDIKHYVKCPICYELIQDATILDSNCGHVFCFKCISNAKKKECPMCKAEFYKTHRSEILNRMIKDVKTKCTNENCNMMIPMIDFDAHKKVCLYESVNCITCKKSAKRLEFDAIHGDSKCDKCGATIKKCDKEHEKVCPEAIITCPNKNCSNSYKQKDKKSHTDFCPFELVTCNCGVQYERQADFWKEHNIKQNCKFCKSSFLTCSLGSHEKKCPERTVNCKCGMVYKQTEKIYHNYICPNHKLNCQYKVCDHRCTRKEMIEHQKKCPHMNKGKRINLAGLSDYSNIFPYKALLWNGKEVVTMASYHDSLFVRMLSNNETFLIKYMQEYKNLKPITIEQGLHYDYKERRVWHPVEAIKVSDTKVELRYTNEGRKSVIINFATAMESLCYFRAHWNKYVERPVMKGKKCTKKRDEDSDEDIVIEVDSDDEEERPRRRRSKKVSKKRSIKV